jgi:hypothetical protein
MEKKRFNYNECIIWSWAIVPDVRTVSYCTILEGVFWYVWHERARLVLAVRIYRSLHLITGIWASKSVGKSRL